MKKIFTLAAAMLASFTLMAQTAIFGPFTVTTESSIQEAAMKLLLQTKHSTNLVLLPPLSAPYLKVLLRKEIRLK